MANQNYHPMNNFMGIYLILGLSRVLVDGFISYPQIEGGKIWIITSKRVSLGYTATSYQIYYWDMDNKLLNNSKNITWDEVINDIEI